MNETCPLGAPAISLDTLDGLPAFVQAIVTKHFNRRLDSVYEHEELVQIGCLAALEALPRWKPDGGAALSTFVWYRAFHGIQDAIRNTGRGPRRDPHASSS